MTRPWANAQFTRSFHSSGYRYLWFSDSMVGWAEHMEFLVLAWYVLTQTDSPFLVGLYGALRFTGTLFAPFYGVVVDRYPRDKLIVLARTGFGVVALVVLVLSLTDVLQVWHVFILVGISGMGRSFDNVARQSLVADLVDGPTLRNAVALTRMARDATQIVGPVVGGIILTRLGMTQAYVFVLAMYVPGALLAARIRPPFRRATGRGEGVLGGISHTLRYAGRERVVLAILLMAFLVNLTGFPLNQGILPVFARDVLETGADGFGLLLGAYAVGGFCGSLVIAAAPRFLGLGRIVVLGSLAWHAAIIVVSQMRWFGPSLAVLVATGLAQSFTMVTMSVLLLTVTAPEVRGRVMGLRSLAVYGLPIGLLASGAGADAFSAPQALVVNGTVGIVVTVVITLRFRSLWRAG